MNLVTFFDILLLSNCRYLYFGREVLPIVLIHVHYLNKSIFSKVSLFSTQLSVFSTDSSIKLKLKMMLLWCHLALIFVCVSTQIGIFLIEKIFYFFYLFLCIKIWLAKISERSIDATSVHFSHIRSTIAPALQQRCKIVPQPNVRSISQFLF